MPKVPYSYELLHIKPFLIGKFDCISIGSCLGCFLLDFLEKCFSHVSFPMIVSMSPGMQAFMSQQTKEWELEKETKENAEVLLIKSSGIILVFLPAFYLTIWPMTHQRNFNKIAILKI
jgi:hypothetical protein